MCVSYPPERVVYKTPRGSRSHSTSVPFPLPAPTVTLTKRRNSTQASATTHPCLCGKYGCHVLLCFQSWLRGFLWHRLLGFLLAATFPLVSLGSYWSNTVCTWKAHWFIWLSTARWKYSHEANKILLGFREQIRQGLEELQKVLPGGDTYMHEGFERVIHFKTVLNSPV